MYSNSTSPSQAKDPYEESLHRWILGMAETVPEFGPYFGVHLKKHQLGVKD